MQNKRIEISIPAAAVGFGDTIRILKGVAVAKTFACHTTYGWRPADLMPILNLYGEVGTWEMQVPRGPELRSLIDWNFRDRIERFLEISRQGPPATLKWLREQETLRNQWLDNFYSTMAEFGKVNQTVLSRLGVSINVLKAVRFGAEMALIYNAAALAWFGYTVSTGARIATQAQMAYYGGVGTQLGAGLVGFGKSITFSLIKSWDEAHSAKTMAILFETGKAGANEGIQAAGAGMTKDSVLLSAAATNPQEITAMTNVGKQKAVAEANARVALAEKELQRIVAEGPKKNSKQARRVFDNKVAQQKAVVAAEKKTAQAVEKEVLKKLEWEMLEATEKEAMRKIRAESLRQAGKFLTVGGIVGFGCWDAYDAVTGLFE